MLVTSSAMASRINVPDTIPVGDATVNLSNSVKNLGFYLDTHLEMTTHVRETVKSANYQLRRIGSIRKYLTSESAATLVCALILSRLDYCNSLLFNCEEHLLDSLQRVQNSAARMVSRIPRRLHITPFLMDLHWLPIRSRIKYKIATLVFKCKNETAPQYLKDLIHPRRQTGYGTRASEDTTALGDGPQCQKTLGDRSFSCAAPSVWNSLPRNIRDLTDISAFKTALKTHLFRHAYS